MPANGKRFELPKLTPVNFSLTDGTDIPPPPDSPIEEAPPPPTKAVAPAPHQDPPSSNAANGGHGGSTRTSDAPPLSPTRPSSIRRFLSRKSLNANYNNGTNTNLSQEDLARPDSPASFMTNGRPSVKGKKSGSWFRRVRSSVVYEVPPSNVVQEKKPMGPPPPKLPELKNKLPEEGGMGAEDMFKNIK